MAEIVHYIDRRVQQVEQRQAEATKRLEAIDTRFREQTKATEEMKERLVAQMRTTFGGHNGRGLTWAWIGVAIGMLGTIVGAV